MTDDNVLLASIMAAGGLDKEDAEGVREAHSDQRQALEAARARKKQE